MSGGNVVALVGNPHIGSRTLAVAIEVAETLTRHIEHDAPVELVDLSALGPHLLSPSRSPDVEVALTDAAKA
ncbi:hypothetical protein ACWEPL_04200 [Nonomuraea sp. NPDC004186]